jgi:hypothetical protein
VSDTLVRPAKTARDRAAELRLRKRIELAVERLISALDVLDSPTEDLEEETDAEEPDGEPSLGATLDVDQEAAWRGSTLCGDDGERERDDSDHEPALGALEWSTQIYVTERDAAGRAVTIDHLEGDQLSWGLSGTSDLEHDPADLGEPEDGI